MASTDHQSAKVEFNLRLLGTRLDLDIPVTILDVRCLFPSNVQTSDDGTGLGVDSFEDFLVVWKFTEYLGVHRASNDG